MGLNDNIQKFLQTSALACDLKLYGFEMVSSNKSNLLRVYIDSPTNISSDDCHRMAKQIKYASSIDFPALNGMPLEVSSPGVERLLFSLEHCQSHVGKVVKFKTRLPRNGQRNFKGQLQEIIDQTLSITLDTDSSPTSFEWQDIDRIRLVYTNQTR
ncbi:MAG: ribosome maturation factor RimP [Pseudomonadota bacterium]|nr:ribosome maturation factor RimP [Pseudomonadota bacterium]